MQEAEVEEVCAREFTARLKKFIEADKGTLLASAGSPSSTHVESDPAMSARIPSSAEASPGGPAESHHPRAGAADTGWPATSELIDEKASLRRRDSLVFSVSSDGRARARMHVRAYARGVGARGWRARARGGHGRS